MIYRIRKRGNMKQCEVCKTTKRIEVHIPSNVYVCTECLKNEYGIKHNYLDDYFSPYPPQWENKYE